MRSDPHGGGQRDPPPAEDLHEKFRRARQEPEYDAHDESNDELHEDPKGEDVLVEEMPEG